MIVKEIVPKNKYRVRTSTGERVSRDFDEAYLNKVAATSNAMIANGLRIPAPFDHHPDAKPVTDKEIEMNSTKSSFNNAGYWKKFYVKNNSRGVPALYGELDVKGDENDPRSPAWKVKNTNEEVSVSIAEDFEDGLGRKWSDGLLHVAVVNHAVVPDQEPFGTVVNMSMVESDNEDSTTLEEIKAVLPRVGVNLPGSTKMSTFLRDLLVALKQVPERSPDNLEPVPIYMSIGDKDMPLTEAQAKAIVDSGQVNPVTSKAFTMEDLGFKKKEEVVNASTSNDKELLASLKKVQDENESLKAFTSALKNKFVEDTKAAISKRISALRKVGIISEEQAKGMEPKIEFQMSVANGKIASHPLEETLDILESHVPQKKGTPSDFPTDATIEMNTDPNLDLTDEQMDKALSALEQDGYL